MCPRPLHSPTYSTGFTPNILLHAPTRGTNMICTTQSDPSTLPNSRGQPYLPTYIHQQGTGNMRLSRYTRCVVVLLRDTPHQVVRPFGVGLVVKSKPQGFATQPPAVSNPQSREAKNDCIRGMCPSGRLWRAFPAHRTTAAQFRGSWVQMSPTTAKGKAGAHPEQPQAPF